MCYVILLSKGCRRDILMQTVTVTSNKKEVIMSKRHAGVGFHGTLLLSLTYSGLTSEKSIARSLASPKVVTQAASDVPHGSLWY
jgi:hypothetical protein